MYHSIRRRRGGVLIVLMSIMVGILFLMGLVIPAIFMSRETANRVDCARNLRDIGQGILLYCNDARGPYPRTIYDPATANHPVWYTGQADKGGATVNPFGANGPAANDVSAGLFLLLRIEDVRPYAFVCPSSGMEAPIFGDAVLSECNFREPNLSYSYANPYPDQNALNSGFKMTVGIDPNFAVAADINPGGPALTTLTVDMRRAEMLHGNSPNHYGDGQNILFGDGHVEFDNSPFVGCDRDNIYTRGGMPYGVGQVVVDSPYAANDSVLLPVAGPTALRPHNDLVYNPIMWLGASFLMLVGVIGLAVRGRRKSMRLEAFGSEPNALP